MMNQSHPQAGSGMPYPYPYSTHNPHQAMGMPSTGFPTPMGPSGYMMPSMAPSQPSTPTIPGQLPAEESYIENILRLNLGKNATIYMTFENNSQWNAKVFKGRLEAAGRDHIIISDLKTGMRYLLLMVNLDYITFDEELNYTYPFNAQTGTTVPITR